MYSNRTISVSTPEIIDKIHCEYLEVIDAGLDVDDSTIRKKLKEYEQLGILKSRKCGRDMLYSRAEDKVDLQSWQDAIDFFSEEDPLGVIGSYIIDKYDECDSAFNYKHHYILHSLDSQILLELLQGIDEHRAIEIQMFSNRKKAVTKHTVCPLKILVSVQTGRQYLFSYHYKFKRPFLCRIDNIYNVSLRDIETNFEEYLKAVNLVQKNMWGVSLGQELSLDHIEMTIHIESKEYYIIDRLEREKRCGHVEKVDNSTYKYVADVFDAGEMLNWLRTFIGRIEILECSNKYVTDCFYADLTQMNALYGGDDNAVQ